MFKIKNIHLLMVLCLILPVCSQARGINTELMNAARAGKLTEVRDLIAKGADINTRNAAGKTALMMAASLGNVRIVDILLAEGADVNAKDKLESTALIAAAYQGNLQILKALLAQGADPGAESKNGVTAISTAKMAGHEEVVKFLEEAEKTKRGTSDKYSKSKRKNQPWSKYTR